ncbi:DUF6332 family protein [Streptomyces sp. NPDC015131]|uniref:DUF6332 family protein n=1 Tax=Streptomyces sp. NPDC015131 TaxID=3364941 RepID=UPI0037021D5D
MGKRTQAERDAITVEIGFALVTGVLLAALLFAVCAAPVWVLALEGDTERGVLGAACAVAGAGFLFRVVRVLWRFSTAAPARTGQPGGAGPDA